MRTQTKLALVAGFLLLFVYGIGIIILIAALIDYAMQKKQTKFVSRS
jgi:type III secretory pathway component EscU